MIDWPARCNSAACRWFAIQQAHQHHPERRKLLEPVLFSEYPLGREVAMKSLLLLEPLDRASCRANTSKTGAGVCDWGSECPVIYPFIRLMYSIPAEWPPTEMASKESLTAIENKQVAQQQAIAAGAAEGGATAAKTESAMTATAAKKPTDG